MRVRSAVASALFAASTLACNDAPRGAAPDAAIVEAGAVTAPSQRAPVPPHALAPIDAGKPMACRVVSSEGGPGPTADASVWITLAEKTSFSVRIQETGKELRFEGPGDVRACGGDVALVVQGTAVGIPGAAETPGNEQWVATPCGVVRWTSGVHKIAADKDGCRLQTSTGTSFLWLPEGARLEDVALDGGVPDGGAGNVGAPEDGWRRIDGRRAVKIRAEVAAESAVAACEKAAAEVDALVSKMADGGTANLGDLTVRSITARKTARAACSLASTRVHGSKAAQLEARLAKATGRLTGSP